MTLTRSRTHGPRKMLTRIDRLLAAEQAYAEGLLARLQALRTPVRLAFEVRARTDEERRWCLELADALDRLIARHPQASAAAWILEVHEALERVRIAGEAVLPGFADPSVARKVRKRG